MRPAAMALMWVNSCVPCRRQATPHQPSPYYYRPEGYACSCDCELRDRQVAIKTSLDIFYFHLQFDLSVLA